ncbi:MAG: stage V sporulation protein D, partial [Clostridia bacterium]|nr:stage V sporulation protein D [Clostridia bacterium]
MTIFIAITFFLCIILGRLFYVQVIWGEELQEKALDQWTRELPVIAPRGKITDVNGVVLVDNRDTYTVFLRKRAVTEKDKVVKALSSVLNLSENYLLDRIDNTVSGEIVIKRQVEKALIDKILEYKLNGIYYSRDNSRVYPYNNMLSSVLGFTSADGKGQAGLELYYDKYLGGEDGEILYETDIVGIEIENGKISYLPAKAGLNVKLTIDFDVQSLCEKVAIKSYEAHSAKSTSIIVLDPNTGAVLGLAKSPSTDLNNIDRSNLDSLNSLIRNNVISDVYEPGSTFKVLTTAANIEEYLNGNKNAYSTSHVFSSSRYRYIDGQRVKCWSDHKNGKHSSLNIEGALNNSCNPIFVDMAMSLGKETMYKYIELFNYGSVTGIDFLGESSGMVLPYYSVQNVDLARIAFGQTIAVTPLQLAAATAAAINGGKYYTPYFLDSIYTNNGTIIEQNVPRLKNKVISEKASKILNELLEKVVADGSGKHAYIEGYRVAGKTGTAQKYQNGVIAQGKYVSSFVGYFPANSPKYLALVIIDEPVGQYYGS